MPQGVEQWDGPCAISALPGPSGPARNREL